MRIYSSLQLTGGTQSYIAQNALRVHAFQMAIDDFTAGTGKLGNFTLDLVSLNDADPTTGVLDPNLEQTNANKAASDPAALAYLGPTTSAASKLVIPITNKAGLAMISPFNTYPGLTRSQDGVTRVDEPGSYYPAPLHNYFRIVTPDDLQGPALVQSFLQLKAHTIFVIDDSDVYGKGLADSVVKDCKKYSLDCTRRSSVSGTESSFQALSEGIKKANPDAIFFSSATEDIGLKLLPAIRAAGITVPFVVAETLHTDKILAQAITSGGNVYATYPGITEDKLPAKGEDFLKRFRAKYGDDDYPNAIYAYEAMYVALTALKTAGSQNRTAVIQALAGLTDYDGFLGKWGFDKTGDTTFNYYSVAQAVNGKWQVVSLVKPS
jgi:branched-chain amino acid transport system substrate-binding protein